MNKMNELVVFGNLGINPELKYTQKREPVCYFTLAEDVPESEKPNWHKVVVWGKQAENCKLYLSKGSLIFVRGRKTTHEYSVEGVPKTKVELIAEYIGIPLNREAKND